MSASVIYGSALALLGAWGIYAVRRSLAPVRGWSWRRRQGVAVEFLFIASCLGCAAALWSGLFCAWMTASIGLSYLLMLPVPCYFESVNRIHWLHKVRDLLFVAIALFCFSVATGLIPLSLLGLP